MSSRRRPYLDLKASFLTLFRTPARWLHDIVAKESIFEKPYLDQDYRQMHLNMPRPTWPSLPDFPPGFFPDKPGLWTFKWDPGICNLGVASGRCGDSLTLGVSVGLLPPGSLDQGIIWSAQSSDPAKIQITSIDQGISGTIHLQIADGVEGTVTICAQGQLLGEVRKELTVQSPFSGTGSLDYRVAANLPALSSSYYKDVGYDCGCTDIEITCFCVGAVWDTGTSAETVGASSSCTIAIIEPTNSWKTWSVSGTGFWLDAGHSLTSLYTTANSVTLYTDADACGVGIVQVCGVTGYVRCTTGQWVLLVNCGSTAVASNAACSAAYSSTITKDKNQYIIVFGYRSCADLPTCPECIAATGYTPAGCTGIVLPFQIDAPCGWCGGIDPCCMIDSLTLKEWQC